MIYELDPFKFISRNMFDCDLPILTAMVRSEASLNITYELHANCTSAIQHHKHI